MSNKASFLGKSDPWALGDKHVVTFIIKGQGGVDPTFTANTVTLKYGTTDKSARLNGSASYSGNQLISPSIEILSTDTPGNYTLAMTGTYDGGQIGTWYITIPFYKP